MNLHFNRFCVNARRISRSDRFMRIKGAAWLRESVAGVKRINGDRFAMPERCQALWGIEWGGADFRIQRDVRLRPRVWARVASVVSDSTLSRFSRLALPRRFCMPSC
ncbi:hypothetical protein LMG22931_02589 [Paraburkholderia nemoris]|nr:hypothetical protein LMG22931_02589 [Paraburkholderia nemoris]